MVTGDHTGGGGHDEHWGGAIGITTRRRRRRRRRARLVDTVRPRVRFPFLGHETARHCSWCGGTDLIRRRRVVTWGWRRGADGDDDDIRLGKHLRVSRQTRASHGASNCWVMVERRRQIDKPPQNYPTVKTKANQPRAAFEPWPAVALPFIPS